MMKTRVSASAAEALKMNAPARKARRDRMPHRSNEETEALDSAQSLRMINHEAPAPAAFGGEKRPKGGHFPWTRSPRRPKGSRHERPPRYLQHLPRDY